MKNLFGSIRYNAIGPHLKKEFGFPVAKLAVEGGFTCPNRDGTKGTGGCTFCCEGGSSYQIADIPRQMEALQAKWPDCKFMAYFQNYSNTYAPAEILREKYNNALAHPGMVGLAIATRPDCLPDDVMEVLKELNDKTYLWVELGLQTTNDQTAELINRGYLMSTFNEAISKLKNAGIKTVVHLIFGLPGENRQDMISSVNYVGTLKPFGIKFHHLYLMEGSRLAKYPPADLKLLDKDEYINLLVDSIETLPQEITIHRLGGDPPPEGLIAPLWSLDKRSVLNSVQMEFKRRASFQGIICQ